MWGNIPFFSGKGDFQLSLLSLTPFSASLFHALVPGKSFSRHPFPAAAVPFHKLPTIWQFSPVFSLSPTPWVYLLAVRPSTRYYLAGERQLLLACLLSGGRALTPHCCKALPTFNYPSTPIAQPRGSVEHTFMTFTCSFFSPRRERRGERVST